MLEFISERIVAGNIVLMLFLVLLVFSCFQDELWRDYQACRYFLLWGVGSMGLLFFEILAQPFVTDSFDLNARRMILFFYLFSETLSTSGLMLWELEMIREKIKFSEKIVIWVTLLLIIAGAALDMVSCNSLQVGDNILEEYAENWHYLFMFYEVLALGTAVVIAVLCLARKLGKELVALLLVTLIIPGLTFLIPEVIQSQWTKFVTILMIFGVYLSMWKVRKEEYAVQGVALLQKDTELAAKKAELAQKEMELTNNRVALMMSQIQPHFLYNTLSSIARLCTEDPEKARQVAMDFSAYFRENLQSLNSEKPIPFTQELAHTETYLNIELARFPDTLHVEYNICAEEFYLPALTLQPIVENAVKHGITRKEGGGTLTIESFEQEDAFEVTVSDDGIGFEVSGQTGEGDGHIGLNSVRQRLMNQCQGALIVKSVPGKGTTVTIYVPKEGVNG